MRAHTWRRVAQIAVAALFMTSFTATVAVAPASADGGECGAHNEQEMIANNGCPQTDIVTPPAGQYLTRDRLLQVLPVYEHFGFGKDFIFWAPQTKTTSDGLDWAGCRDESNRYVAGYDDNGPDNVCDIDDVVFGSMSHFFGGNAEVTILGDRGAFIAIACGNMSRTGREYHPHLSGEKFHDRNANGARDQDEPLLSGWQFQVTLTSPAFPAHQQAGWTTTVSTGADGRWSLDIGKIGPGQYSVEELPRDGWTITNGPAARTITAPVGAGSGNLGSVSYGNVQQTDTAKASFTLIDPPSRIDADKPYDLIVQVELVNNGPTQVVDVIDEVVAAGPSDCTITPSRREVRARLQLGQPHVERVTFQTVCTDPSHHDFAFSDVLRIDGDVRELQPENNTARLERRIEVYDDSDIQLSDTSVVCTDSTKINTIFTCTGTTTATNAGPYGPTDTDISLALTGPSDCIWSTSDTAAADRTSLDVGQSHALSATWDVNCTQRSFHPFSLRADAQPDHIHIEDHWQGDNTATATDTTEVFEDVDLEVNLAHLACSEREASRSASACDATIVVTNNGPADQVKTLTDVVVTAAPGCTASPATVRFDRTLAAGASQTIEQHVDLACTDQLRHDVLFEVSLSNDPLNDPHAVDSDSDRLAWIPTDAKPRSLPSSVNIGKEGALPFAVLATASIDPLQQVVPGSLRYGVTGDEDSVTGCKAEGEDVDGDGKLDLVCIADTQSTGITCDTTFLTLTGRLTEGIRFVSQDDVKVLGCGKNA